MKKYKYILFDADETLLNFSKASDIAFKGLLNDLGITYSNEIKEVYETYNMALWHGFERGEISVDTVLVQRWTDFFKHYNILFNNEKAEEIYQGYLCRGAFLLPGALDVLNNLKDKYKLFIITNGVAKTQRERLGALDLFKYFDYIFISQEMKTRKPESNFFDQVTTEVNDNNLHNYLVVGDSLTSDIKGGFDYGIDTCFINMKKVTSYKTTPTYVIDNIAELLTLLN